MDFLLGKLFSGGRDLNIYMGDSMGGGARN